MPRFLVPGNHQRAKLKPRKTDPSVCLWISRRAETARRLSLLGPADLKPRIVHLSSSWRPRKIPAVWHSNQGMIVSVRDSWVFHSSGPFGHFWVTDGWQKCTTEARLQKNLPARGSMTAHVLLNFYSWNATSFVVVMFVNSNACLACCLEQVKVIKVVSIICTKLLSGEDWSLGVSRRAVLFGPSRLGLKGSDLASGLPGEPHTHRPGRRRGTRRGTRPSTEKLSPAFSCPKSKTYK